LPVRGTQEVVEVVVASAGPGVRISQEVLEVVVPYVPAGEPNAWTVRAIPLVRWDGTGDDPHHPRGQWVVNSHPRIEYDALGYDPINRWFVNCEPKVAWVTGPGAASTECISSDGVVPPPDEEPPESLEQNYVF
jgi:hypothetical protein